VERERDDFRNEEEIGRVCRKDIFVDKNNTGMRFG